MKDFYTNVVLTGNLKVGTAMLCFFFQIQHRFLHKTNLLMYMCANLLYICFWKLINWEQKGNFKQIGKMKGSWFNSQFGAYYFSLFTFLVYNLRDNSICFFKKIILVNPAGKTPLPHWCVNLLERVTFAVTKLAQN